MTELELMALLKQFGLTAMLIGYFIWRDGQREVRLGKRLDDMQDRHSNVLETVVKDNTLAMHASAKASEAAATGLAACGDAINRLRDTIERKT